MNDPVGARLGLKGLAVLAALVAGAGCQAAGFSSPSAEAPAPAKLSLNIVWPEPPEPARIRYLRSISVPEDLGIKRSFFGRVADAITGKAAARLVRPTGVAERDGTVYVADPGAQAVWIFDPESGASTEVRQAGDDTLVSPVAVAVGRERQVFVADSMLGKVWLLDRDGKLVRVIAGDGLKRPAALAYDDATDRLYVADSAGQQVAVYTSNGQRLASWGGRGIADGQFNFPSYLALLNSQTVLVTDALNYRVQAFDPQGRFLWKMGHQGDSSGDFAAPKGVAADSEGHLYVVDALFETVQIFDREGALLLAFGRHGVLPGQFWLPTGAFIDPRNRIYVADSYNHRIEVFEFLGGPGPASPMASK